MTILMSFITGCDKMHARRFVIDANRAEMQHFMKEYSLTNDYVLAEADEDSLFYLHKYHPPIEVICLQTNSALVMGDLGGFAPPPGFEARSKSLSAALEKEFGATRVTDLEK